MKKCNYVDCISTTSYFLSSQIMKCILYCQKGKDRMKGSFVTGEQGEEEESLDLWIQCLIVTL